MKHSYEPFFDRACRWAEDGNYCCAGGIQTVVGGVPAPGIPGAFASANANRYSTLSGPGGLVAGSAGVIVGHFGWLSDQSVDPNNAAQIVNSFGAGAMPDGFVSLPDSPAIITTYLSDATMVIQQGAPVPLKSSGDFWCKNDGATQALVGQKAYAALATGAVSFAATGTPTTVSLTTSSIAANTTVAAILMTGSISDNVLTVTAVTTGTLYAGTILTGPSGVASGTQVVKQLTGTAGGIGTYALSIAGQAVASGAVVGTYGILTVGAGTPVTGAILSGPGGSSDPVTTGTAVWQQLTSSTWVVSPSQTSSSATITAQTTIETNWYARSSGGAGEVIKISNTAQ